MSTATGPESKITVEKAIKKGPCCEQTATRLLCLEEYPGFLVSPAKGQFPTIEAALAKQQCQIPENWDVEHILAALAVAGAEISNDRLYPFSAIKEPQVSLTLDPYFEFTDNDRRIVTAVKFRITTPNNLVFVGEINTPDFPKIGKLNRQDLIGIPKVTAIKGKDIVQELQVRDFVTEEGRKTILFTQLTDSVAKIINNTGTPRIYPKTA